MKIASALWFGWTLSALALTGCRQGTGPTKEPTDFPIKGKVVAVNPDKKTVKLDHEDIPGLMPAMTMTITVQDAKVLQGLKPGDKVEGRLKKDAGKFIITELKKR